MSETVTISQRTYNNIERTLNRVLTMLNNDRLNETISEEQAAEFLEVGVDRLRNMVYDGTIPQSAYVTTVNNKRKYFKEKLVK